MTETAGYQDPKVFQEKLNAIAREASESTKVEQNEEADTEAEDQSLEEESAESAVGGAADDKKGDDQDVHDKENKAVSETSDGDDEDDSDTPRIPRKRLNKEIDKRRVVEEDLIRTKTKLEAMEAAIAEMFKPQSNQQQQGEEIDNIEANIDALDERAHSLYMKEIKALRGEIQQLKQGNEQNATNQAISNFQLVVEKHYKEYTKDNPDAEQALDYLVKMKQDEASHLYADDKEAYNAGMRQLQLIADAAIRSGKNVAATMYDLAKKHGYRPNASKGGAPNLAKIEENRKKSASVSSIPAASSATSTGVDWEKLREKTKGGYIDPKVFHEALERQQKARSVS